MPLDSFPTEILLLIASTVRSEADLASLAQTNRRFYDAIIARLYPEVMPSRSDVSLLLIREQEAAEIWYSPP